MPTSVATVATARADRYLKQLASHLGRKCRVEETDAGTRLTLPIESQTATCLLTADGDALVLQAEGADAEELDRVRQVVGGHLERFGERDGLVVTWRD